MGPSGSGKSTLLHCLAGLDRLTSGQIFLGDVEISALQREAAHADPARQARVRLPGVQPDPHAQRAREHHAADGAGRHQARSGVARHRSSRPCGSTTGSTTGPTELSGGQQQRVAVGRALLSQPEIIFADEPTGNLDSRSGAEILTFMRKAVDDFGQTIVMVTHDPIAAGYADRVVFLADGEIVDELARARPPTRVLDKMKSLGRPEPPCGRSRSRASGRRRCASCSPAIAVDARRRVHVRHVRAHRHHLEDVRRPVQRHLPAHRRGGAGQADLRRRLRRRARHASAPTCSPTVARRRRASRRPTGRCRASRSSSTRRATRWGATARARRRFGFACIPDRDLSTIHVVDGRGPRDARRGRDRQEERRRRRLQARRHRAGRHEGRPQRLHPHRHREVRHRRQPARRDHRRVHARRPRRACSGTPGQFDSIDVKADSGVSQEQVVAQHPRRARERPDTANVEVISGNDITQESQNNLKDNLSFFNTFLLIFGVVALLVGSFIIFNTFSIIVAQRGRELALLRAIGAGRAPGARLGAVRGGARRARRVDRRLRRRHPASPRGLKALLGALGLDIPAGSIVIPRERDDLVVRRRAARHGRRRGVPGVARRRGSRRSPRCATRRIDRSSTSPRRAIVRASSSPLLGRRAAAARPVRRQRADLRRARAWRVVFIGVAVLGPDHRRARSARCSAADPPHQGHHRCLARENAMRNPKRTSATAAALMIGVAPRRADHGVRGVGPHVGRRRARQLDEGRLRRHLARVRPGLDPARGAAAARGAAQRHAGVGHPQRAGEDQRLRRAGHRGRPDEDRLALRPPADRRAGSPTSAPTASRCSTPPPTTTAGRSATPCRSSSRRPASRSSRSRRSTSRPASRTTSSRIDAYEKNFRDQFDFQVYVKHQGRRHAREHRGAQEGHAHSIPARRCRPATSTRRRRPRQINQFLNLVYVLLFFAIVIALFGIANTLGLSIIERRHELGLLVRSA